MNRPALATALLLATLATACTQKSAGTAADSDSVATVDGHAISANTFNQYATGVTSKPVEELKPEERSELLDNLIRAQVVAGEAEKLGIATNNETRATLELQRLSILQQAVSKNYLQERTPSEEELRAEYDIQVGQMPKKEYRASHILLPNEAAASDVIEQLNKGAKFATLAREKSMDNGSAQRGGDLDWFTVGSMTPAFAQAVVGLNKGETTAKPVQSEFGWHVIQVTDTRESTPPPFEAVRDRLIQIVERKKFDAYVDGLLAAAKVTKTPGSQTASD